MENIICDKMEFEVHYTRKIEADGFFEAVDIVKNKIDDVEEVITVCPLIREDIEE